MSEKRFKIDLDEEAITDNGGYCLSLYCFQDKGERDVCDLLNELNEENEKLREVINQNEMIFQSMHDELSRLRSIVKSARIVKINLEHIWESLEVI